MKTCPIYKSPKWNEDVDYGVPQCVCCGRKVKVQKYYIHATTDWVAVDEEDQAKVPNSQGHFDIGAECRKHFPPEFIFQD